MGRTLRTKKEINSSRMVVSSVIRSQPANSAPTLVSKPMPTLITSSSSDEQTSQSRPTLMASEQQVHSKVSLRRAVAAV
jgi:hypothetical protein